MRRTAFRPAVEAVESRISLSLMAPSPSVTPLFAPPDSGDGPPVTQPTLPGTGPGGPGTSS